MFSVESVGAISLRCLVYDMKPAHTACLSIRHWADIFPRIFEHGPMFSSRRHLLQPDIWTGCHGHAAVLASSKITHYTALQESLDSYEDWDQCMLLRSKSKKKNVIVQ